MDIRVGREDAELVSWSVLADIAITMVLVLVLFVVVQFLATFRERFVNTQLALRQKEVRNAVLGVGGGLISVDSLSPDRQKLTFKEATLFDVCRAELKPQGLSVLSDVGGILRSRAEYFEAVNVEGHTDSVPITGRLGCPFPSNWELSSARATSVVSLFSREQVLENPKLSAIGRSQYHPVNPLDLASNRRIELILQYDRRPIEAALRATGSGSAR